MYISKVHLRNIRCFADLKLSFDPGENHLPWTVVVGDNATGKTALLRSIALGLCDESSAAGLMKESDEGYIRRDQDQPGSIIIELRSRRTADRYRIHTRIEKIETGSGSYERVRQRTTPKKKFPWDKLFVCAYGVGRGTSGTGDIVGWSLINAVYNLFNYNEGLQNPELMLHRLPSKSRQSEVTRTLGKILLRDKKAIQAKRSGIVATGPWGPDMPLRDVADGYRSSLLWITDMIGWAFAKAPDTSRLQEITGIVLVDELEQHLHATLQRDIVHGLRLAFPKIQFIVTTHSPLIASSIGPLPGKGGRSVTQVGARDRLVYLHFGVERAVLAEYIPSMRLQRVDQVLASRAFKYLIDADPSVETVLRETSVLAAKRRRNRDDEARYRQLCQALEPILLPVGQTLVERELESKRYARVMRELRKASKLLEGTNS